MKKHNKSNFHKHTFCLWQEVPMMEIENLVKNHQSKSGSGYVFVENGVYRISNHWGRVANCRWRLLPLEQHANQQIKVGYASWTNFYENSEQLPLFFIKVDFETNEVHFHHKFSPEYDGKSTTRNAAETSKVIKIIKDILEETSWAKHLHYNDLAILRKKIVEELLYTKKSFLDIKKKFL